MQKKFRVLNLCLAGSGTKKREPQSKNCPNLKCFYKRNDRIIASVDLGGFVFFSEKSIFYDQRIAIDFDNEKLQQIQSEVNRKYEQGL